MRFLTIGLLLGVTPALAQEKISYPVPVPSECSELAVREHVPTLIENRYQAAVARVKLARLSNADPLVTQCKQAIARVRASLSN